MRSQRVPSSLSWDVLIVDNNSHDGTAHCVRSYQRQWARLRYCFEPRQGLAYARRCAIKAVTSDLIGFLDDDTLPDPDWVQQAHRFGLAHPKAGAYGSAITGEYASPPPPGFERIASCLAIIQRGASAFQYGGGVLPAGAGMVVRRRAWLNCVPAEPRLTGVCGTSLTAKGEDVETLDHIRRGGWPIWHNPAMGLTHLIPSSRLQPDYLLHLCQCIGRSRYPLRYGRYRSWQRAPMLLLHSLNDLRRLLHYWLRHRIATNRPTSTDIVTACEYTLLVYSLTSPLYGLLGNKRESTNSASCLWGEQPPVPQANALTTVASPSQQCRP